MTRRILATLLLLGGAVLAQPGWQEGLQYYADEDYERAQRSFEKALREDPESSKLHLWVGLAAGRRVQTMSGFRRLGAVPLIGRVKRQFEKAVELDGSNIDALDALMGFLMQAPGIMGGSKSDARRVAEHIQRINPAHGAYALGIWHEAAGEMEAADTQYGLARKLAPDQSSYITAHAGFLARRGSHAASDELFEVAFAHDAENPDVWLAAAKAWIGAKRKAMYPRAKQLAERYLASTDRSPSSDPAFEVSALLKRITK